MPYPDAFTDDVRTALKEWILRHRLELPKNPQEWQKISGYFHEIVMQVSRKYRLTLDADELVVLEAGLINELVGFGLLDSFIRDPDVSDIFVNGPDQVYVEKHGRAEKVDLRFKGNADIAALIDKMMMGSGRRIDHSQPYVDFKLKGGLRVTAVIPPVASGSPLLAIRKMSKEQFTFEDLKRMGTVNDKVLRFIEQCVKARVNILVSGSTGTGKTTLTNLMIRQFIPAEERIIVIEDVEEMVLPASGHSIKILTRPPNLEGKGEIDLRDLVKLSLHLRPDRIMIGEIRGEEAFHFLHAINTGHEGSMCTIHASNPEDALNRLEILALMDRPNIQPVVIRRLLALGIDMIIQMVRLPSGQRVISSIADFSYVQDACQGRDIFTLEKRRVNGKESYDIRSTGVVPSFMGKLRVKSDIREDFFRA